MPDDLTRTETFAGVQVRVIVRDGAPQIPIADISTALKMADSSGLRKLYNRHEKTLGRFSTRDKMARGDGTREVILLNRKGVIGLLMMMRPEASKDPDIQDRIIAFQEWAIETLSAAMHPVIPARLQQEQKPDLRERLEYHGAVAKTLIDLYDYAPDVARKLAMQAVVQELGDDARIYQGPAVTAPQLEEPKPALHNGIEAADPDFDRMFSLQKIAEICHCTRGEAANILETAGVIKISHGITHLTRMGETFGKRFTTYPQAPHRWNPQVTIRYYPSAVNIVRNRLGSGQAALTTTG